MLGEVQAPRACARGAPLVHHSHVHSARPTRPHERIPQVRWPAEAQTAIVPTAPAAPETHRVQIADHEVVNLRGDAGCNACVRRMHRCLCPHPVPCCSRPQPRAPLLCPSPAARAPVRRALAPVSEPQQPLRLPLHPPSPVTCAGTRPQPPITTELRPPCGRRPSCLLALCARLVTRAGCGAIPAHSHEQRGQDQHAQVDSCTHNPPHSRHAPQCTRTCCSCHHLRCGRWPSTCPCCRLYCCPCCRPCHCP